jgi:hypothetical protein
MPDSKRPIIKRTLVALGVAGVVFAAVYGLAASLAIESATLGAGSHVVAACQSGTISVSYTDTYSASLPGYQATTVTLGGLETEPSKCGGKAARVTLSGAGNASLGEYTGTVPTSGSTMEMTVSGISAASVTGVSVVIAG